MVIHTYSVLIQNAKTQELFQQYQSFFSRAIDDNRIGICKWNESGTTIETALPELSALTEDKEEWRAVIVRHVDDNCMAACECSERNPYDFAVNKDGADVIKESEVPLIRLTQMLGGVPAPEVRFEPKLIKEGRTVARTVYVPLDNTEQEEAHRALAAKYRFNGKAPSSILLISIREQSDRTRNDIGNVWVERKEVVGSEFWKRNRYPSICRFLVYDYMYEGKVRKTEDDFNFWFSVMLLAVNEIGPSVLQAYRLYTVNTVIDREKMTVLFQKVADRLRDAKYALERELREETEQTLKEEKLPDYRMDIPVMLKVSNRAGDAVDKRDFFTFSKGADSELAQWYRQSRESEEELASLIRSAERTLDQTAERVRVNCRIEEDAAEPLNKYQEEDMQQEIDEDFKTFIELQERLSNSSLLNGGKIAQLKTKVEDSINIKVARAAMFLTYGTVVMLLLLSFIPILIQFIKGLATGASAPIVMLAWLLGITAVFAITVPIVHKLRLNGRINRYNRFMEDAFQRLNDSSKDYSEYLSVIVSHARGASYLSISSEKTGISGEEEHSKYRHLKAINVLLAKIKGWARAHHLELDFTSPRLGLDAKVDTTIRPGENKLYTLDAGEEYEIEVNNSGMKLLAPFPFAEKIEIVREEIYDDECR